LNHFKLHVYIHLTEICFSDEDFLQSEVINRPQGNLKEEQPLENGKELQMLVSIKKKTAEGSTSSNSHWKAVLRRRKEQEFIHRTSFPSRKQKQPSGGAGQLGDQR